MRRIVLDARNISSSPNGVGNYGRALIRALLPLATHDHLVVIRHASCVEPVISGDTPGRYDEVTSPEAIGTARDFVWGRADLHRVFRRWGGVDLYHDLFHVAPLGLSRMGACSPRARVVTLHDLIWIDHARISQKNWLKAGAMRAYASAAIGHTLRRADRVICVSEATREAVLRRGWVAPHEALTIPHGVASEYFEPHGAPDGDLAHLSSRVTIVAVGNSKEYKNLSLLVDAFADALPDLPDEAHLVLVGPCEGLTDRIKARGIARHVTLTGFLETPQLCRVLASARCFVFPSLVEGFGLPPLEAMALGTPVVISDIEPMRSIGGRAVTRVSPHDPRELAGAITRIVCRDEVYDQWRERGRARAREFSWARAAAQTWRVYEEALGALS